jgi:hypothetical protein
MKKIFFSLFLICILAFTSSCSHYYYAPNAANIPLFKEKNTLKLKGGYSGDYYDGADIQMAYSVSKNIGVMVNSFFAGETENVQEIFSNSTSHPESGKGSYIEAGVGYYQPFGKKKVWIFEIYGGAGVGGETHMYASSQSSKLHLTKYFIQPSFGYSAKKGHFEVGLSSRFSALNLKLTHTNLSSQTNQSEKQNLDYISLHPSSILWEPSLMIAVGGKYIKFYLQLTFSNNLNNPYLAMDEGNVSLGIKVALKNSHKKTQ